MVVPQHWYRHKGWKAAQHAAFWALSFFLFLHLFKSGNTVEHIDYVYTGLFHLSLLPAVYLNLLLLVPALATKHKWLTYGTLLTTSITLFSWINFQFFEHWSAPILPNYFFISYFTGWQVAGFFCTYIGITTLLKLSRAWFTVHELQHQLLLAGKEKAQLELKALKAQLNPHFFFNTLNNIYSMSLHNDQRLPGTILQLSELMRYFLYDAREEKVSLHREINLLKDYIALQQIRSNEQLTTNIQLTGDAGQQLIAPLLLITFLENAFKHGGHGSGSAWVNLIMHAQPHQLNFRIENSIGDTDHVEHDTYKGLGLQNVQRQLELLYPQKHQLSVENQTHSFIVTLQMQL